jgi:abhydrolase domain-containing protein 17
MGWLAAVAGIALAVGVLRTIENRLIYFPPRYPHGFPSHPDEEFAVEDVWMITDDGVRIHAFFRSNPASRRALLWFHGNAENIGYDLPYLKTLAQLGVNILAVDYRGYGRSEGKPNEAGVYHDADAAFDYLVTQRHFRAQDIVVYGVSFWGAVGIDLAARRPCGGVIIQSSFTNAGAMARRMFGIPLFEYVPMSRFDSLRKIRNIHSPILIAHGTRDEVVPYEMGQQLFRAANEPKRFYPVEGSGHNNMIEVGGAAYLDCLRHFVTEAVQ